MNYNLVEQLKEEGFPLEECKVGPDCQQWWYMPHKETLHAPTLEELIEACGEKFSSLDHEGLKEWRAYATEGEWREDLKEFCEPGCCGYTNGSIPTEAVARLWLMLNKKI